MSEWKLVRLDDAYELQMGKTPSRGKNEYWNDGANKWISIADIGMAGKYICKTKETISDFGVKESGIKLVPKNTVIMSFKLSIGKTCIVQEDMYTNEAIMAFIDKGKYKIDNNYIYHLFRTRDWSAGTNKAVMGITLNKATLSNIMFPLPPIEIQKHIAEALDKASEIISLNKQRLEELDILSKAIFYDMFGDPVNNKKGWERVKLGIMCDIITGNTPPRNIKEYYGDYLEWIKSDNISNSDIYLTKAAECLSKKGLEKGRWVNSDSILMTCIAGSIKCIGNVAITDRKVSFNQQINAIIPKKDEVLFLYVLFLTTKHYIQRTINMSLKGILSKGKLSNLEFIKPPIPLQKKFVEIFIKIEEQKDLVKKAITESECLFNSLMNKYFE